MKCVHHADREVEGICTTCGRPACDQCLIDLNGQMVCKECLVNRMKRPSRQIHSFVRFALSVVPGLGHLYMGMFARGIQFAAVAILGGMFLEMLLPYSDIAAFLVMGMVFLSIFDAREIHLRLSQGIEVEDKGFIDLKTFRMEFSTKYIGYGLIAFGGVALYNTFLRDLLRVFVRDYSLYSTMVRAMNGVLLGGLAIAAGLYLLKKGINSPSQ